MNEENFDTLLDNEPHYEEVEDSYNRHYIVTRPDGVIIDAWSDGPHPEKDTTGAICINAQGDYQLRLYITFFTDARTGEPWHQETEENPPIFDMDGIPLYKWDGEHVLCRTEAEIAAERALIPTPPPSPQEQLRADVDFIAAMTGVEL